MIEKNIEVLRKILYAVETGGQVYGNQRYDAFMGAGANTPNEKAITIGAGQWYAGKQNGSCRRFKSDPVQFKHLDTQDIEGELLHKNWSRHAISPTSAKAKCIIKIISSPVGIKSQDKLMDTQIAEYAESIAETYGNMPDTAMMECINIIHQGGAAALKRILGKTQKPSRPNVFTLLFVRSGRQEQQQSGRRLHYPSEKGYRNDPDLRSRGNRHDSSRSD